MNSHVSKNNVQENESNNNSNITANSPNFNKKRSAINKNSKNKKETPLKKIIKIAGDAEYFLSENKEYFAKIKVNNIIQIHKSNQKTSKDGY